MGLLYLYIFTIKFVPLIREHDDDDDDDDDNNNNNNNMDIVFKI